MTDSSVRELRPSRATSYFRVGSEPRAAYVFFDDESRGDSERAWDAAARVRRDALVMIPRGWAPDVRVAVYRPTLYPGPWDDEVQVVGYRKRRVVEGDPLIGVGDRAEELRRLEELFAARRRNLARAGGSS